MFLLSFNNNYRFNYFFPPLATLVVSYFSAIFSAFLIFALSSAIQGLSLILSFNTIIIKIISYKLDSTRNSITCKLENLNCQLYN